MTKPSHTGWILPLLLVGLPLAGLGGHEALQRHRFNSQGQRLDDVLRAFAATASIPGLDGKPLPTASGRKAFPYFSLATSPQRTWEYRAQYWTLGATFVDEKSRWHPFAVVVRIQQTRHFLLRKPEIIVEFEGAAKPTFGPPLLKDLQAACNDDIQVFPPPQAVGGGVLFQ